MPLLGRMIRNVAITGRTDVVDTSIAGRQGGRWAQQWVDAAFPDAAAHTRPRPPATSWRPPAARRLPAADPQERLRTLDELRRSGAVSDAEFEALRAGLPR